MSKKHIIAGLLLLVAGSLLIAACSGPTAQTASPTVDTNLIITQAAQTVAAGQAQTQAAKPTEAPTATLMPTNTIDPNVAINMTATAQSVQPGAATPTLAAGQATAVPGQATLAATPILSLPTATLAVVAKPPAATGDKGELVGQNPADGTSIQKSASFDMTIVLKNVGTTTWTKKYALVFYAGDRMGSPNDFQMPHEVKPGETVQLVFGMKASDTTGTKKTIWAMRNESGVNFYDMWLEMKVTN
jgi:hypothetical protein